MSTAPTLDRRWTAEELDALEDEAALSSGGGLVMAQQIDVHGGPSPAPAQRANLRLALRERQLTQS